MTGKLTGIKTQKLYAERDPMELEPYFSAHMSAMTGEGLHSKAAIAAELAWRDAEIARLMGLCAIPSPSCDYLNVAGSVCVKCGKEHKVNDLVRMCSKLHKNDMMFYAVRCCCTPRKILGYIKGPVGVDQLKLTKKHSCQTVSAEQPILSEKRDECFQVEIRRFAGAGTIGFTEERAIYSDDRPIEFWRNVNGFVEAME